MWVWPPHDDAHDPVLWTIGLGRFDEPRWRAVYRELFDAHDLIANDRRLERVEVSEQADGGLAVVDIDTRWRHRHTGEERRWRGRVCKVYALVNGEWKLTMHTGALTYPTHACEAARHWAAVWERAWPVADVEAIRALYADDAFFHSHPFRPHQDPEEYVAWAFADQSEAKCRFGEPLVDGDRAAVDWWAVVTARDGSVETLAGTSLLRFGDDGLVVEQRDVWASQEGRVEVPCWAVSASRSDDPR